MIQLERNRLRFRFPEVHPDAELTVSFQRTLRIPDDGEDYALPPGLGRFPVRHVDDHAENVPPKWLRHGGVLLPMYQAEAMWLDFSSPSGYPFAVKVAAGKINAVTGEGWDDDLHRNPQDYVMVPEQPWLDGYCVEEGTVRQFVATPLGEGYTAEEQITGEAEHGGLQLVAYPLEAEVWEERRIGAADRMIAEEPVEFMSKAPASAEMGLSPGGRMRQEIYDDPEDFEDWDRRHRSRCFVHLANALVWRAVTGEEPPTTPPTSREYTEKGLPWFDYYAADRVALEGSEKLAELKSVIQKAREEGGSPLPENESVETDRVVALGGERPDNRVREGSF